jgi:hypothetical protein
MSHRRRFALVIGTALLCTSCLKTVVMSTVDITPSSSTTDTPLRSATNLPAAFSVVKAPATAGECPPLLADSAMGITLSLRRSVIVPVQDSTGIHHRAIGDYEIMPAQRYGASAGDGLRVDCTRMRGIGVIAL